VGAFFVWRPEVAGPAVGRLLGMLAAGTLSVPIHRQLPLAEAAEAHRLMEVRELHGEVVLKPWS
jgi:NADPH2:quinone reductase